MQFSLSERKRLGLYFHIPFCVSKCAYCDFNSAPAQSEEVITAVDRVNLKVEDGEFIAIIGTSPLWLVAAIGIRSSDPNGPVFYRQMRSGLHGKPFAIILNSANPDSSEAHALAAELEEKYGAPVALVCCPQLNAEDIREILALVLGEFPVREMSFTLPEWTEALPNEHPLKAEILDSVMSFSDNIEKLMDIEKELQRGYSFERVSVNAGDGTADFVVPIDKSQYYATVSQMVGLEIDNERALIAALQELGEIRKRYEKVASALADVEEKGYGIVMPTINELRLEEPTLVKQANGYGVKVTAHADSIHMIKTGIKADLCPVIGSEEQSEEVVKFLVNEFEENPDRVWQYNMFGKSLYDMVSDGMSAKLSHMPDESREKLGETLGKIINEGAGGLICILL